MIERKYYRVAPDSPVMVVIYDADEKQRVFGEAMKALQVEFGTKDVWVSGNRNFLGITLKGELPDGWRKGKDYSTPDKRVKAGKLLAKRFAKLPHGVDAHDFTVMLSKALGADYECFGEGKICWTVYHKYGDTYVLSVPAQCKAIPPGCEELKMSEYWAIKEAAEAAKVEAA